MLHDAVRVQPSMEEFPPLQRTLADPSTHIRDLLRIPTDLTEIPSQQGFSTTGVRVSETRVSDAAAIELPFHLKSDRDSDRKSLSRLSLPFLSVAG